MNPDDDINTIERDLEKCRISESNQLDIEYIKTGTEFDITRIGKYFSYSENREWQIQNPKDSFRRRHSYRNYGTDWEKRIIEYLKREGPIPESYLKWRLNYEHYLPKDRKFRYVVYWLKASGQIVIDEKRIVSLPK